MKTHVSILIAAMFFGLGLSLSAQEVKNSILSDRNDVIVDKKPAPLPEIFEENVMWKKTIIREIDFRQKINQVFYYPVNPTNDWKNLITVLYAAILDDDGITPYRVEETNTDMILPWTVAEFEDKNTKTDENNNLIPFKDRMRYVERLMIKEDWYFDKHLSQMLVRIIAICPVAIENDERSEICWIPYDEKTRKYLSQAFVANRNNGAERRTYDEILIKRMFDSYIIKEENVYDRFINEYAINIDALYESERIKNEMLDFEENLWEY